VLTGKDFGIPLYGTMAHSFIETFDDETAAFAAFARSRPDNLVLLLDTYDTEAAARKVVALAPRLKAAGIAIRGVRLDSGNLVALSRSVRGILDAGGLADVTIFASGGLDEDAIAEFARVQAPIDGFGVGTTLTTSSDAPVLDCVYKLQEYAGAPRRKRSANKATWPGRKQVWRHYGADGRMVGDRLTLDTAPAPLPAGLGGPEARGAPLIELVMQNGRRLRPPPSLDAIRQNAKRELERLPEPLRRLEPGTTYAVEVADELKELAAQVDRRLEMQAARSRS
jgi:nicotinate phosphoribosyltransferase